jgi:hypothetical protein
MNVIRFPSEQRTQDRNVNRVYPETATVIILPCIRIERHEVATSAREG